MGESLAFERTGSPLVCPPAPLFIIPFYPERKPKSVSLYIIGDPHLSLSSDKPMDIFSGWTDYVERLAHNWTAKISQTDTVIVAGDVSWAMTLEESLADLRFLHELPGRKLLLKGNHDYWWSTARKMTEFFNANGLSTLEILHNNCAQADGKVVCGSRGWMMEAGQPHNAKLIAREAGRLEASLKAAEGLAGERIAVLHYPPVYGDAMVPEFIDLLLGYHVRRCYYGHVHGPAARYSLNGSYMDIEFRLIAGDAIGFDPLLIP